MTPIEEINAQPVLQPGESGWWKVWGAQVRHIRPGDAVCDNSAEGFYVVDDLYLAKSAPMRVGIIVAGERMTIGALTPIVLLRRGTHNTLAEA